MTLEEFKKNHPDVANAYKTEILAGAKDNAGADTQAAVEAERARNKAIDEITLPGFEGLAKKAKYEEPVSAEAFAMQIVAAQKKTGQAFLNDREDDEPLDFGENLGDRGPHGLDTDEAVDAVAAREQLSEVEQTK